MAVSIGGAKRQYLGSAGYITGQKHGMYDFIYTISTARDSLFNVGDPVDLPDGRQFVYSLSSGEVYTGRGNVLFNAIPATGIDYANNIYAAAAIGDRQVVVTNGSTVVQTANGLRGGSIVLKPAVGSSDAVLMQRKILGNTACGLAGQTTIYLDAPLTAALSTSSYSFCMPSPFLSIKYSDALTNVSHVGPAATYVPASGYYFWVQTAGRCWLAPQSTVGVTDYGREVVWRYDGSIQLRTYNSAINGEYGQVAGYIVDNNQAGNGATEICLTGGI